MSYRGSCLCGASRFEAQGEPNDVSVCHCRTCQRAAGADSVTWAGFPLSKVLWEGVARRLFASSPGVERSYCADCGSSLSYQIEADSVDLVVACFEQPEGLPPGKEIWLEHRLPWNALNPDLPGYQRFKSDEVAPDEAS